MSIREMWGPAGERLLIVGLTGGIASGKSEVAEELARQGAEVIDADLVAREIVVPGAPTYKRLVEEFGKGILDGSGSLDRTLLAKVIFGNEDKRRLLNGITHPAIFSEIAVRINSYADNLQEGDVPAAIVDAALIVDIGASGVFDLLLVVTSDESRRFGRLVEFRGMADSDARERIESQVPDGKRLARADIVIENNGSLEELRSRVAEVWEEISRLARDRQS